MSSNTPKIKIKKINKKKNIITYRRRRTKEATSALRNLKSRQKKNKLSRKISPSSKVNNIFYLFNLYM
jgi:hypothetical protein